MMRLLFSCAAVLVSFANGLAQPLHVVEATETSGGNVIQITPDGQVGTISLAGQLKVTVFLKWLLQPRSQPSGNGESFSSDYGPFWGSKIGVPSTGCLEETSIFAARCYA